MTESLDSGTVNTLSSLDENTANSLSVMDLAVFVDYLKKTVSTILQGDKFSTSPMLDLVFEDSTNVECIKKFLSDPNTATLFVQKSVIKGNSVELYCVLEKIRIFEIKRNFPIVVLDEETENGGEGDDDKDTPIFYLSNEVIFTNQKMTRSVQFGLNRI